MKRLILQRFGFVFLALLWSSMGGLAQNLVTFRVNLGVKTAEGLFDPASDQVVVRGSFNGWPGSGGLELADPESDGVYEGVADLADSLISQTISYKFVSLKGGNATWEGDPNRTFVLSAGETVLPQEDFDRDSVVSVPVNIQLRFEVDLNVQSATGRFDPANHLVYVRGNRFGWGSPPQGLQLLEDSERPGVYVADYTAEAILAGTVIEYKFTIWKPAAPVEADRTVWEGGENKKISFDGKEPDADGDGFIEKSAGLIYFDGLSFSEVLDVDTEVTFRVDMSQAVRLGSGAPFDPTAEGVYLSGQFAGWWTWGSKPADYLMVDDGTGGDETAGDVIYSWRRTFLRGDSRRLEYKYGIESADNEAGFASNHVRYINAGGSYVLPLDVFGTMVREEGLQLRIAKIERVLTPAGAKLALSWIGGAGIVLQRASSLSGGDWQDVEGSLGLSQLELDLPAQNTFYRLRK